MAKIFPADLFPGFRQDAVDGRYWREGNDLGLEIEDDGAVRLLDGDGVPAHHALAICDAQRFLAGGTEGEEDYLVMIAWDTYASSLTPPREESEYTIQFLKFSPDSKAEAGGYSDGARADDYLPGYEEQRFSFPGAAEAWIAQHHVGPDCEGVTAVFVVEETSR